MQISLLPQNEEIASFFEFVNILKMRLRASFGDAIYSPWFADINFDSFKNNILIFKVQTNDIKNCILINYSDKFLKILNREFEKFFLQKLYKFDIISNDESDNCNNIKTIEKSNVINLSRKSTISIGLDLEQKYNFENYISGDENHIAIQVARTFADKIVHKAEIMGLDKALFISGSIGNGKTHLAHAIANTIISNNSGKQILYITSEIFMFNYINAIKENAIIEFQKQFIGIDLLILDDVHHILQKKATIEMMYKIASSVISSGGFVVACSTSQCNKLDVESRTVKSFFNSFYQIHINEPSENFRFEILKSKVLKFGYKISDQILKLLASKISSNIRELESTCGRLLLNNSILSCKLQFTSDEESAQLTKFILSEVLPHKQLRTIDVQTIVSNVCINYVCSMEDIISKRKTSKIAFARQVAMYLTHRLTTMSYIEIGRVFGGRTHSTVLHAIKIVEIELNNSAQLKEDIEILRIRIENGN